ncbi:MAG: DUF2231 domain-containing protein [Candidatus Omnitrophica bacterium]|nr:DUF2231 domain-containing protein [Candidatus Omnitrophota bacterium]
MRKSVFYFLGMTTWAATAFAHKEHEHVSNFPLNVSWGIQGLRELINIHPVFVHFPIALLLTAAAFYFLGTFFHKEDLFSAGKWVLYLGTLSAVAAVWTGLQAAGTVSHGGDLHQTLMAHQYAGFVILGLCILLSLWLIFTKANIPQKGKTWFLIILFLLAVTIVQQADFGGRLVFLNGVGIGRKIHAT